MTQNYQKRSRLQGWGGKRQAAVVAVNARRAPAPLCTAEMPHQSLAERWKRVGPPALADTASRDGAAAATSAGRRADAAPSPPAAWAWLLLLLPSARAGAVLKETGRACSGPNGATAAYQAKHMGNYTTPRAPVAAAEDPYRTGWVIAYPPNYGTTPTGAAAAARATAAAAHYTRTEPVRDHREDAAARAPAAPPVCASTTDIQTACGRPIKAWRGRQRRF